MTTAIDTTIDNKGQIAIPPALRSQLGLLPGTAVQLEIVGSTLQLRRKRAPGRGKQLIAALQGKATRSTHTDEMMQLTRSDE